MLEPVFVLVESVEPLGGFITIVGLALRVVVRVSRTEAYVARQGRHIAEAYVVPCAILVYLGIIPCSDAL